MSALSEQSDRAESICPFRAKRDIGPKVAFDLIDDLDGLTNVGKVMARLSSTLAEFGYTSFLITGVPEPPQKLEPYILLNGWPKGWTEHYTKSNYYADDPVAA